MNKVQARDPIRFDSFPTGIEKDIMARKLCECFMKFYEVPENRERLDRYAKELKKRKEVREDEQKPGEKKSRTGGRLTELICEGLCIAAFFPLTVGFIWLSESLERALRISARRSYSGSRRLRFTVRRMRCTRRRSYRT